MKPIDLNALPYKFRFNGASLLISKANRLCDMTSPTRPDRKTLLAAMAYYDLALALMKPYDPNYSTVVNWKCNVLQELGQFEEAVSWHEEIIRISDETDGKGMRNATASLAEEMIRRCQGRGNAQLDAPSGDEGDFDEPPYCMFATEFCALLTEQKFKKAHALLAPALKEIFPAEKLKEDWGRMVRGARSPEVSVALEEHMLDWSTRKAEEIGWCYFSVSTDKVNEAVAVVVGRTPQNSYWITDLELGRP